MQFFANLQFNSLEDLLMVELQDLYDAEQRITQALPKMIDAATSLDLKDAFRIHLGETHDQIRRLEHIFVRLGRQPERETCEAMQGLIRDGEQMINAKGDPDVRDAALIAAAQRIEHYEIAGYGCARTFARRLGLEDVADVLQTILDEEIHADKKLTEIAESSVNVHAAI